MKNFIQYAYEVNESQEMQKELQEKKMRAKDLEKARKNKKKYSRTPEAKKADKLKKLCNKKIKGRADFTCNVGANSPTKVDKSKQKSSRKGARSRT